MDEKKVRLAVRSLRKRDPEIKKSYDKAPTPVSLRHRELSLYYMWFDGFNAPRLTEAELDEFYTEIMRVQSKMDLIDWSYISKCATNTVYKTICKDRVELLQGGTVPKSEWQFMYDNLIDKDPFRKVCRKKLDDIAAEEKVAARAAAKVAKAAKGDKGDKADKDKEDDKEGDS